MENLKAFLSDLSDVLEVPENALIESYELTEEKWDSLAVISCIALLDDHFGMTLQGKELQNVKSIGELLNLIQQKKR